MTTSDYQQRLSNFYSVLNQTLHSHREATRRLDRFLSTDFNIFKVIRPKETRLSEIIADLLDQDGSHGQQRRFLDAFLHRIIKRTDLDKKPPKVDREVLTTNNMENPYRRIDIVVEFKNKAFGLGIENKSLESGGGDLPGQLEAYYYHLRKEYGEDSFCLVYLTPDGGDPDENSIACSLREELKSEGKLICIAYRHDILKWLRECHQLCESDKFRWFLRDFMDHINGGQTMSIRNERDIILKHALEKENLETALDINFAFNGDLDGKIIGGFLDKLEKFVLDELQQRPDASERWRVNNDDLRQAPLRIHKRFSFGKESWGDHHGVILAPASDKACDFAMGVWKKNDPKPIFNKEDRLREKLTDLTADFANIGMKPSEWNNEWWVWHSCLTKAPYQHWNTKEALFKLHNDAEAVRDLGSALVEIIRVIDEHVKDV